jgi:hypothetical protein
MSFLFIPIIFFVELVQCQNLADLLQLCATV